MEFYQRKLVNAIKIFNYKRKSGNTIHNGTY